VDGCGEGFEEEIGGAGEEGLVEGVVDLDPFLGKVWIGVDARLSVPLHVVMVMAWKISEGWFYCTRHMYFS